MKKPLQTELRQRAYDGKWQLLAKVMDHDNAYTYQLDSGQRVTLTPERWITVGVYDYLITPREGRRWKNWKERNGERKTA